MEGLSNKALIECAKICAGSGNCADCDFCAEDECERALLKALASALEEVPEGIEWIDIKMATPAVDDEYLVMISGFNKPTVLLYDVEEDSFYAENYDLEPEWYPVTHWAELPTGPAGVICESTDKPDKRVKRCATCAHEDKLGDEERCIECEKHNLWEERDGKRN